MNNVTQIKRSSVYYNYRVSYCIELYLDIIVAMIINFSTLFGHTTIVTADKR